MTVERSHESSSNQNDSDLLTYSPIRIAAAAGVSLFTAYRLTDDITRSSIPINAVCSVAGAFFGEALYFGCLLLAYSKYEEATKIKDFKSAKNWETAMAITHILGSVGMFAIVGSITSLALLNKFI